MTGPRTFVFLNEAGSLDTADWDPEQKELLWRYNLHYFEDLTAHGAEERGGWHNALIKDWIASNPPAKGTGWAPYPLSLRVSNWIKWHNSGIGSLSDNAIQSLAVQVRWLTGRLEKHLLGNHLFVNAKALVLAGQFFEGSEAEEWYALGLAILKREVPEQILQDGGQFELSPMYHSLALEDAVDLLLSESCSTSKSQEVSRLLSTRLRPMVSWLAAMTHPDDEISFFNDAAFDIAPPPSELRRYAVPLLEDSAFGDGTVHLSNSGYARIETPDAVLIAAIGPIGPDYLPGHAHADTLSFELSIHGQRVVVNSGTSRYGVNPERLRQRGTPAHSTVCVDGQDSSEVWSGFRVARRATVHDAIVAPSPDGITVSARHDGYRRLRGGGWHRRVWTVAERRIEIHDSWTGDLPAESRLHLHPEARATIVNDTVLITLKGGQEIQLQTDDLPVTIEPSTFHPAFGVAIKNQVLCIPLAHGASTVTATW